MAAQAAARRSQAERREATIGRLLDATVASLAERGYAKTTASEVCRRAALSQGALFRHFSTRSALIAAATEEVCRRHLELLAERLEPLRSREQLERLIATVREAARSVEHAAWHEVMVAARTDRELRLRVTPALEGFERALLRSLELLIDRPAARRRFGMVMLSLMHLFDSEAVTVAIYENPTLEADRHAWLCETLAEQLGL